MALSMARWRGGAKLVVFYREDQLLSFTFFRLSPCILLHQRANFTTFQCFGYGCHHQNDPPEGTFVPVSPKGFKVSQVHPTCSYRGLAKKLLVV